MGKDWKSNAAGGDAEDRADQREEARQKALDEKISADAKKTPAQVAVEEKSQHIYWRQKQLREEFPDFKNGSDEPPDLSPKSPPRRGK